MSNWVSYKNGNYNVSINLKNGTKIRENDLDYFEANTVESMDIKITNYCSGTGVFFSQQNENGGCPYCHENSGPNGKHADLREASFLDKLHPYAELAIGGGNPLSHPDLDYFLQYCKDKEFISSMTVNQVHFEKEFDRLKRYRDEQLIYGLGISLMKITPEFIEKVKEFPNAVIHVINGIVTVEQLEQLKNNNLKILILGYKEVRRGIKNYADNKDKIDFSKSALYKKLPDIIEENWFRVVSFDNLAIKQLDVRRLLDADAWEEFYMGNDGLDDGVASKSGTSQSMFVDMVERKFAKNSCSMERFDLMDTIEDMYSYLYRR